MPRNSYARDPRWITARYPGDCSCCGARIFAQERVLYWPYDRSIMCTRCGDPAWRRFESEAADEYALGGF